MADGTVFIDVGHRLVAIAAGYLCGQKAWRGLVERQISPWRHLLDFYKQVYRRDTTPVRYWIEVGQMMLGSVICFIGAVIGWWQPGD
jgi:hypothetical protein